MKVKRFFVHTWDQILFLLFETQHAPLTFRFYFRLSMNHLFFVYFLQ